MGIRIDLISNPALRRRILDQDEAQNNRRLVRKILPEVETKRIRQGEKPLNKLERDWKEYLEALHPTREFMAQALRFRLANGVWYKPDVVCFNFDGGIACWECKGPMQMKNVARGIVMLKCAATTWPTVRFILVWRDGGWQSQVVRP